MRTPADTLDCVTCLDLPPGKRPKLRGYMIRGKIVAPPPPRECGTCQRIFCTVHFSDHRGIPWPIFRARRWRRWLLNAAVTLAAALGNHKDSPRGRRLNRDEAQEAPVPSTGGGDSPATAESAS